MTEHDEPVSTQDKVAFMVLPLRATLSAVTGAVVSILIVWLAVVSVLGTVSVE